MIRNVILASAVAAGLAACTTPVDTSDPSAFIPAGSYVLVGFGPEAVPERDSTVIVAEGVVRGQGPCNGFTAENVAVPPEFAMTNFVSTRVACKRSDFEAQYFRALQSANGIRYDGGVLTIMGPTYLTYEPGRPE